jgi:hypothetical protein
MPCVYLPGPAPAVTVANNTDSWHSVHLPLLPDPHLFGQLLSAPIQLCPRPLLGPPTYHPRPGRVIAALSLVKFEMADLSLAD